MSARVENTEEYDAVLLDELEVDELSDNELSAHRRNEQRLHAVDEDLDDETAVARSKSDHNIVLDKHDDRWHWRRRIRANPRKLGFYRAAVGVAGLVFVILGLVTGPLPGPGGIPLILLGLAIWSSEFERAQRVMLWFKARLAQFRSWNRWQQTGFWVAFFSGCGLLGYCSMLIFGIPPWAPAVLERWLSLLPGL